MSFPHTRLIIVDVGRTAPITIAIKANGSAVDLTAMSNVDLKLYTSNLTTVKETVTMTSADLVGAATNGTILLTPTATLFNTAGFYGAQLEVTWTDTTKSFYPNGDYNVVEVR